MEPTVKSKVNLKGIFLIYHPCVTALHLATIFYDLEAGSFNSQSYNH